LTNGVVIGTPALIFWICHVLRQ